jgi:serine O-acetyltransferase
MFQRVKEDINCVFARDPAARNHFEVLTTYPGVHAIIIHRMSHVLWHYGLKWLARIFSNIARFFTGIEIHPAATIGRRFFIDHGMGVVIGETAVVGDDCTLYHGVTLGGTSWQAGKRHPTLENDVVIGAGAKILGPITLASGVRVGSNAVVVKNAPVNTTIIGIPGREIKRRSNRQKKREDIARKMGFDAYGATQDTPDPVSNAIHRMLDHIHLMDEKMERICAEMQRLGSTMEEIPLPEIKTESFDKKEENL